MERNTIQHLCSLSRLDYDESELDRLAEEMTDIVALMDGIRDFDLTYDDTKDNNSVCFSELRGDSEQESLPAERLLSNARSSDGCFVVPRVVE